jgi:hypothetical protein
LLLSKVRIEPNFNEVSMFQVCLGAVKIRLGKRAWKRFALAVILFHGLSFEFITNGFRLGIGQVMTDF